MTAPALSAQTRLLVVAPHPDDETLGAGMLIQQVVAAGGSVKLLLLTNGDNNPWPQRYVERRWRIDLAARQRWGAKRRAEVMRAIVQLGVPTSALEAFEWPDMGLTKKLIEEPQAAIGAISTVLQDFAPTIVVFPALADRHPDHSAAHVLCRLAIVGWGGSADLLAFPVHTGQNAENYPIHVVGTDAQLARKLDAMSAYDSQMALSGGRMRQMARQDERFERVGHSVKSAGARVEADLQPPAVLRPWLRLLVAAPSSVRDYPLKNAPVQPFNGGSADVGQLEITGHPAPRFVKMHLDWPSLWIFDHWGWREL